MKALMHVLSSLLVLSITGSVAQAQTAPKMKMTTVVPPGIAIPDRVDTRLGTLHFFDGFPDNATVEKLYDNLDFQRAVQAYLLGLAPVSQLANRKGIAELGPINRTVPIFEDRMDSKSLFLTPNNNTPYTWFWLDLRGGPVVMEVPPKVLGLVNDMWYQFVSDVGFTGPDKGEGGKYLLLPPGYSGEVPAGYHVIRCATYSVWIPWRSFLVDGDPKPGVERVEKFTRIYSLKDAANPPQLTFVHVSGKDFSTLAPADYTFWEYLNQVVQEEPTDTVDPTTLGFWDAVGIHKGRPFAPDARMKKILEEAALVGDATARAMNSRLRIKESYYYPNSAWRSGFYGGYKFEQDGARVLDAYSAFFFYATGVTPAMDSRVVGMGSQYMAAFVDSNNQPLDGGKNYVLHLPPNIPVKEFWSVILYDNQTRSMLQTDQRWPAATSQNPKVQSNPTARWTSTSAPRPRSARRTTGSRRFPERAGTRCSVSMALSSHGSTRLGGLGRSRRLNEIGKAESWNPPASHRRVWLLTTRLMKPNVRTATPRWQIDPDQCTKLLAQGRRPLLAESGPSSFGLLGYLKRVVHLNSKVADGALGIE